MRSFRREPQRATGRGRGSHARPSERSNPNPNSVQQSSSLASATRPVARDRITPISLLPSVSRSSGLDRDGDALKSRKTQEEYYSFIKEKVNNYHTTFPQSAQSIAGDSLKLRSKAEQQENILILFRKLREGIIAAKRLDSFAIEVYETSAFHAVIFKSRAQTTSTLTHLVQEVYPSLVKRDSSTSTSTPRHQHSASRQLPLKASRPNDTNTNELARSETQPSRATITLLYLLDLLITHYPSQTAFFENLNNIPGQSPLHVTRESPHRHYVATVASTIRQGNYSRFTHIAVRPQKSDPWLKMFPSNQSAGSDATSALPTLPILEQPAVVTMLNQLVDKVRQDVWTTIRIAYREVSVATSGPWLARSLCFGELESTGNETGDANGDLSNDFTSWFEGRLKAGEARKDEAVGKWVLHKVPITPK